MTKVEKKAKKYEIMLRLLNHSCDNCVVGYWEESSALLEDVEHKIEEYDCECYGDESNVALLKEFREKFNKV